MIIFWVVCGVGVVLVLTFGAVLLVGAPYVPTFKKQADNALDLLDLRPGQTIIDLGAGDGTIVKMAAERGLMAIGYELNPLLVIIARLRTLRYGRQVKIKWKNFWKADLSEADGVFVFLIGHHMERLDRFIRQRKGKKTIRLASNAFKIPGRKPVAKRGAILLYDYR